MEGNLEIVVNAALGSIALSLLLLAATAVVRVAATHRSRLDNDLTARWTPVFLGIAEPAGVGPVGRADERAVLALWNRIRSAMRGVATDPLVGRAREVGLHEVAVRLLGSRRADDRLNAVAAVGTMGLSSALPALERFARKGSSITLRSEAARALLRLDQEPSLSIVFDLLRTQPDWHPALIASVLEEAEPRPASLGVVEEAMGAAERGDLDLAVRLLRVLPAVESDACLMHVRLLLAQSDEPDLQSSCLMVLAHFADARDRAAVQGFVDSDVWYVRVHAAAALGRIGHPDDEQVLRRLLEDPEWWVRQRAAEALARVADMGPDDLAILFEDHPEMARFAGAPYSPMAEVRP
ncbi:MAG TPA: HEAT repeat domain-containing protein [Mycobacteriales bacterium]|nr:HEAT repeat domain-containing protein [Mycobacteriales bacterium]